MDKQEQHNIVNNIISSAVFQNKEVLKGLLLFLFEAKNKERTVREFDIALEYFNRDENFISGDDTIVRVNIHKLRSLLDRYYTEDGKKERIRLQIPKGSYELQFSDISGSLTYIKHVNSSIRTIFWILLVFSLVLNIILTLNPLSENKSLNHPIWNDYIQNYKPVTIILGDPLFYTYNDKHLQSKVFRDLSINTIDEINNSDNQIFKKTDYPYYSQNNITPLPGLLSILLPSGKDINIQSLSELNLNNAKKSNQIFIANINSFGFYSEYLEASNIRIQDNPRRIIILKESDSTYFEVPEQVNDKFVDYALLVKIPGQDNNMICLMGDFHASGLKGLVGFMTDQKKINSFAESISQHNSDFPKYFEMLVKVDSYHFSDYKTEIIYFKPLNFQEDRNTYYPEMMY